jgi:urease accessory protein
MVNASLDIMDRDSKKMRGDRPFVFTNLTKGDGVDDIIQFIVDRGMLSDSPTSGN